MSHQLCRRRHGLAESPAQRDRPDGPGPQRRIAKDGDVVVIDALRERKPPFSPDAVVDEFAALLAGYSITRVLRGCRRDCLLGRDWYGCGNRRCQFNRWFPRAGSEHGRSRCRRLGLWSGLHRGCGGRRCGFGRGGGRQRCPWGHSDDGRLGRGRCRGARSAGGRGHSRIATGGYGGALG
jgi:hypothetical protein